jgi:hypothetical protein
MSNYFRQSELRIDWAGKKLDEIEMLISASNEETIEFARRESVADGIELLMHFMDRVNYDAVRLISESLFHGRTALDYIVFTLAWRNKGSEQDYTQFPICEQKSHFDKVRRKPNSPLEFLTDEQIGLIESVQPYNGFPVLALLNRISNQDKHRQFALTSGQTLRRLLPKGDTQGSRYGTPSDREGMEYQVVSDVLLEGDPAIDTLRTLQKVLRQILDRFDTLLQREATSSSR